MRKILVCQVLAVLAVILAVCGAGAAEKVLTPPGANYRYPSISPDGRYFMCASDTGGCWNIWIFDMDGANPRNITGNTDAGNRYSFPKWSPDGTRITYAFNDDIYIKTVDVNADGAIDIVPEFTLISMDATFGNGLEDCPSWSPSGELLAFSSYYNNKTRIGIKRTDNLPPIYVMMQDSLAHYSYPVWHWSEEYILLSRTDDNNSAKKGMIICDIDGNNDKVPDGDGSRSNITTYSSDYETDFSPGGENIIFRRRLNFNDMLFSKTPPEVQGTETAESSDDTDYLEPSFSPDGTKIIYAAQTAGKYAVEIRDYPVLSAPPAARLSYPRHYQKIKGDSVPVMGTAYDALGVNGALLSRLNYYTVSYATGRDPAGSAAYTELFSSGVKKTNETLGYFDALPLKDGLYTLKLTAVSDNLHVSKRSVYLQVDNPPDPVTNFSAAQGPEGRIALSWNRPEDSDILNYKVFVSTGILDYSSALAVVPGTDTAYVTAPFTHGTPLIFGIRSKDQSGQEDDNVSVLAAAVADSQAPVFSNIAFSKDPVTTGTVSVSFLSSEPLADTPLVTAGSHPCTFVSMSGLLYVFSSILPDTMVPGYYELRISGRDKAGNPALERKIFQVKLFNVVKISATPILAKKERVSISVTTQYELFESPQVRVRQGQRPEVVDITASMSKETGIKWTGYYDVADGYDGLSYINVQPPASYGSDGFDSYTLYFTVDTTRPAIVSAATGITRVLYGKELEIALAVSEDMLTTPVVSIDTEIVPLDSRIGDTYIYKLTGGDTLPQDTRTLRVYMIDTAGNTFIDESISVFVESVPPKYALYFYTKSDFTGIAKRLGGMNYLGAGKYYFILRGSEPVVPEVPVVNLTLPDEANSILVRLNAVSGESYVHTGSIDITAGRNDGTASMTVKDVYDMAGNLGCDTINFIIDTIKPVITVDFPADGYVFAGSELTLRGRSDTPVYLMINGETLQVSDNGSFEKNIRLTKGTSIIQLSAEDYAGNTAVIERTVISVITGKEGGEVIVGDTDGNPLNDIKVIIPPGAVEGDISIRVIPITRAYDARGSVLVDPLYPLSLGAYEIMALDTTGKKIEGFSFLKSVTVSLKYNPAALTPDMEKRLSLYCFNGTDWVPAGGSSDIIQDIVRSSINYTGTFGIFLKQQTSGSPSVLQVSPNPFTPNRDGHNDLVNFVIGSDQYSYQILILSRDGAVIRELSSGMPSWDGRSDGGEDAPAGLYIYQALFEDGSRSMGTVLLVR